MAGRDAGRGGAVNPLAFVLRGIIQAYRYAISPLFPRHCRFEPTCSAYAAEAICRHGAAGGLWLAVRRMARCHPWGGGGEDPVPHRVERRLPI